MPGSSVVVDSGLPAHGLSFWGTVSALSSAHLVLGPVSLGDLSAVTGMLASPAWMPQHSRVTWLFCFGHRPVGLELELPPACPPTCCAHMCMGGSFIPELRPDEELQCVCEVSPSLQFWGLAHVRSEEQTPRPGGDTRQSVGFPGSGPHTSPTIHVFSAVRLLSRSAVSRTFLPGILASSSPNGHGLQEGHVSCW